MSQLKLFPNNRDIERREAAGIAHAYLKEILEEEDECDISAAAVFRDLYDCGECVNNVAQVYLKGIMSGINKREFGMRAIISKDELELIEQRLNDKSKRLVPDRIPAINKSISSDEIEAVPGARIIDVRTAAEFDAGHIKGAQNIPIAEYALNPHLAGEDTFANLIFICNSGTTAGIAAEYATEAGYRRVYTSAYEKD